MTQVLQPPQASLAVAGLVHDLASHLTPMRMQLAIWRDRGLDPAGILRMERSIQRVEELLAGLHPNGPPATVEAAGDGARDSGPRRDVGGIVETTLQAQACVAAAGQVFLAGDCDDGLTTSAEPGDVARVLENLVRNAIKFTGAGGIVRVRAQRQGGSIRIEVHDSGRGLDAADMARLFRPYSQVRPGDEQRGSGLGLSICRSLVESHGGRIWAESDGRGEGSRFIVVLPASLSGR